MIRLLFGVALVAAVLLDDSVGLLPLSEYQSAHAGTVFRVDNAQMRYGAAAPLGNGRVRSYVRFDSATGRTPIEIGVAIDERAMDGLPAVGSGHHDEKMEMHSWILDLPAAHATPFRFIEVNWNPAGHEPEGVYQHVPHFDFHFYLVDRSVRDSILPSHPEFTQRANNLPTGDYVPQFNVPLAPPGVSPAGVAVPQMGVHWLDVRSPELQQMLGKPDAYRPFTATFIYGSWNGQYHFLEPMITRAHLLAKRTTNDPRVRDEILPISVPAKYRTPGAYPTAYRITWDDAAKEYRVALTQLVRRD